MILAIRELLSKEMTWKRSPEEVGTWESMYENSKCVLAMNDFPEEPLYTLYWENDSMDIDDPPVEWTIIFD